MLNPKKSKTIYQFPKLIEQKQWTINEPLEKINCGFCHIDDTRFLKKENGFCIVQCLKCRLVYVNPRPTAEALTQYYSDYYDFSERGLWEKCFKQTHEIGFEGINERISLPGSILDIGSGYGFFLHLMKKRGWKTVGLELDSMAADLAKKKFGLSIIKKRFEETDFKNYSFDAISLWYVLEHLPEPIKLIQDAYRLLKPNGLLALTIPNFNFGRIFTFFPTLGKTLDPPGHLYSFSPAVIRNILSSSGFEKIEVFGAVPPDPFQGVGKLLSLTLVEMGKLLYKLSYYRINYNLALRIFARKPNCFPV